jgi:hypothetical protein
VAPIVNDLQLNYVVVIDLTINLHSHDTSVTMDTASPNTPGIGSGETTVLLLTCPKSLVAHVGSMKTEEDNIHCHDAPIKKAIYPNKPMPVVDLSCPADCLYWDCHLNGESTTKLLSATTSDHMKHVWKLIKWENGEATSDHMKYVWKLIEWQNWKATIKSHPTFAPNDVVIINEAPFQAQNKGMASSRLYIEQQTRRILLPIPQGLASFSIHLSLISDDYKLMGSDNWEPGIPISWFPSRL